jgi:hypothetical protein
MNDNPYRSPDMGGEFSPAANPRRFERLSRIAILMFWLAPFLLVLAGDLLFSIIGYFR